MFKWFSKIWFRIQPILQPNHYVYLLVHLILFLLGMYIFGLGGNDQNKQLFWRGVGTSIFAAGITGWVVFIYIILSQDISERLKMVTNFGFVSAFEARAARIKPEYDNRLLYVHNQIDVMGFGLRQLREDYISTFQQWKLRANVRILLIDPDFPRIADAYSKQRDREENNSVGTIQADVHKFIEATRNLRGADGKHTFEIRLYKCLPSVNIFRVDDELFWGPYLILEQSRNTPTFIVRRGGILFDVLIKHFDRIWQDDAFSRPVPEEWLNKT